MEELFLKNFDKQVRRQKEHSYFKNYIWIEYLQKKVMFNTQSIENIAEYFSS